MQTELNSLIILDSIDSTNNYAMGLLRTNAAVHGLGVFAKEQTAGKGRRGKVWQSIKGQNIMMSVAIDTNGLLVPQQFEISVVAALATFDLFFFYYKENLKIKWPNDIFLSDRKAAGILIENIIKGDVWQWSVIGIGANINQLDFEYMDNNPVSLKELTNKTYDVINLAERLKQNVLERYQQLKNNAFDKMMTEYNKNLFGLNTKVKLKKGNNVFETTIEGVSDQGELITKDIRENRFSFDEVEWIL
jgi:BirA family biotin operon repressor/biotin-[acetyl-CoA-carboxylase] ligase